MNDSGIVATPLGPAAFPFSPENLIGSQILEELYADKHTRSQQTTLEKLIVKAKKQDDTCIK